MLPLVLITLVVLFGAGFLLYKGVAQETAYTAITTVLAFWFGKRNRQSKKDAPEQEQPTKQQEGSE